MNGNRKLIVALGGIIGAVIQPLAAVSIAVIVAAFCGAHAVADSKLAKP